MAIDRCLLLLNGPNLAMLGNREPSIYGTQTLEDLVELARGAAEEEGFMLEGYHSDSEAELVRRVHAAKGSYAGIVVNAGALTHYSWALADALSYFEGPVVELHLSNTYRREAWRHTSVISPVARGTIQGFGSLGYVLAVRALCMIATELP